MKLRIVITGGFMLVFSACLVAQERRSQVRSRDREPKATVEVVAFDTYGKFLGAPIISRFESYDHKNIALTFHAGVASGVPFGSYQIEAYLPGYSSAVRYVKVYQQRTTVIVGLTFGFELPVRPMSLRGLVHGQTAQSNKRSFVKLSGTFSNLSIESPIASDGGFELAGMLWGTYLLMIISEDGILASRIISIPYDGPPLGIVEITIGRAHEVPDR